MLTITLPFADLLPCFLSPLNQPMPHFYDHYNPNENIYSCSLFANVINPNDMGKVRNFMVVSSVDGINACNLAALQLIEYLATIYSFTMEDFNNNELFVYKSWYAIAEPDLNTLVPFQQNHCL
ncbi:hypothetical protein M5689_001099 [Euphorbia peplus]|nr:hypothetical protein M5689_001099 [Euphorbia peplus]